MSTVINLTRRHFLGACSSVGAGLLLGVRLPAKGEKPQASDSPTFKPNAFVRIDRNGKVTLTVAKSEMGEGIHTALAMLIAEELEVDWTAIAVERAELNPIYGNQETGGSDGINSCFEPLRKAGATARELLIAAAAKQWNVAPEACRAESGVVVHGTSGRKLKYAALVEDAARLPLPAQVSLKPPDKFRIIGRRVNRLDNPEKIDGSAVFGIDVRVPGMLYATVVRSPVFGGRVSCIDSARAKAIPGVREVVQIDGGRAVGVAVVAESSWAALQGRRALEVTWDEGPNATLNSEGLRNGFLQRARNPGAVARREGDVAKALAGAAKTLEAEYDNPFLAHATMEPMNCTAHVMKDRCEIWAPAQSPAFVQQIAARVTGLPLESIRVHITYLGGGFGRRADSDWPREAVQVSQWVGAPVKLFWTREDDIQFDNYRPSSYHRLIGALDSNGWPLAWSHQMIGPSAQAHWNPARVVNGLAREMLNGALDIPYDIPHLHVTYVLANTPVSPAAWRSVAHSQNAFVTECFLDELAALGGKDPLELRMRLLQYDKPLQFISGGNNPYEIDPRRLRGVLQLAANKAAWSKALPANRFRGIACHYSFRTYVAHVAEVSLREDRTVRLERVVSAVDCGQVVNPETVEAQMQGAVVFGSTAALYGRITVDKGRVQQSNFHDYQMLRINDAPEVEVHIVPSTEPPGGIGEPGVPPIIAAVANAVSVAKGKRVRRLPIQA
jgi:isoquinoline 1-oxidoreductase subunit beta